MRHRAFTFRVLSTLALACAANAHEARSQEPGCRTGAIAAANVYVLSNPLYAQFLGDFEQYVTNNATLFRADGDAVRCLAALSGEFLRSSIQLYDPSEQRRRDVVDAELEKIGIPRGRQESTPATELYTAALRLGRLARTLPAAASGNWGPFQTPTSELEQLQFFAEQMFRTFTREPEMRQIFVQLEPLIREVATIEYQAIQRQAGALAGQRQLHCAVTPATGECGQLEAMRALASGNIAGAKQAFLRVRNADPSSERWPIAEGLIWYLSGRLTEAEEANKRALQISPNHFTAHDNLAFILFDLNRVSEALTHWDAALAIRPDDPDALAGKAIAFQSLRRSAEAVALYRRAVRANSSYLDCEVMRKEFYWSTIACEAAAPLIRQVR